MSIDRHTKTVNDVVQNVYRVFGDESQAQVTESDIIAAINNAQIDIINMNRAVNAVYAELPVVTGQSVYDLTNLPEIHRILSIHYKGRKIEGMSFQQAEDRIIGIESTETTPSIWWTFAGGLHLYPVPNENIEVGLKVFYNKAPARVQNLGDLLGVPDSHFNAVLDFCLKYVYEMDENPQMAQMKGQDYGRTIEANIQDTVANNSQHASIRDVYGDW